MSFYLSFSCASCRQVTLSLHVPVSLQESSSLPRVGVKAVFAPERSSKTDCNVDTRTLNCDFVTIACRWCTSRSSAEAPSDLMKNDVSMVMSMVNLVLERRTQSLLIVGMLFGVTDAVISASLTSGTRAGGTLQHVTYPMRWLYYCQLYSCRDRCQTRVQFSLWHSEIKLWRVLAQRDPKLSPAI